MAKRALCLLVSTPADSFAVEVGNVGSPTELAEPAAAVEGGYQCGSEADIKCEKDVGKGSAA